MKEKEILSRIKETAINEMPDVSKKINLANIDIEPKVKRSFNFNFGKVLRLASVSIVLLVTALFAYNAFFNNSSSTLTPLASDTEILGFQTITGAILLEDSEVEDLNFIESDDVLPLSSMTESFMIDDYVEEMNPLIHLMETVLNESDSIKYQEFESDLENYQYAFEYKSYDLAKNEIKYRVYYNNDGETLTGKVILNEKEYEFTKTNLQTRVYSSEENYILIDNESTSLKQKFNYRLYGIDGLVMENNMEISRVNNRLQVKASFKRNNSETIVLNIQRSYQTGLDELEVEFEIKGQKGSFRVMLEESQEFGYRYRYILSENNQVNQPRGPFAGRDSSNNSFN